MPASMPWTTASEMARNQRPKPSAPEGELEQTGDQDDRAEGSDAVLPHRFVDEHGQAGGRAADLERGARQETDDEPADDAGDQSQLGRDPRGDRDPTHRGSATRKTTRDASTSRRSADGSFKRVSMTRVLAVRSADGRGAVRPVSGERERCR